jgi:hypothetical protein
MVPGSDIPVYEESGRVELLYVHGVAVWSCDVSGLETRCFDQTSILSLDCCCGYIYDRVGFCLIYTVVKTTFTERQTRRRLSDHQSLFHVLRFTIT